MGRPTKAANRLRKIRQLESPEEKTARLVKVSQKRTDKLRNEGSLERQRRLSQMRECAKKRLSLEKSSQRGQRLNVIYDRLSNESAEERERRLSVIHGRLHNESAEERSRRLSVIHERLSNESAEEHERRLSLIHDRLHNESAEVRSHRLSVIHDRLQNESAEDRSRRLSVIHDRLNNESAEEHERRLSVIHDRLRNESAEERSRRLSVIHDRLNNESAEERERRLSVIHDRLRNESAEERSRRLSVIHDRLNNESAEERERRLSVIHDRLHNESAEERSRRLSVIHDRLSNESAEERERRLSVIHDRLLNESTEERSRRLSVIHDRLANESAEEYSRRLSLIHDRLVNESDEERSRRLSVMRERSQRGRHTFNQDSFLTAINVFADFPCSICRKCLYPQQRFNIQTGPLSGIIPENLIQLGTVVTCSRCSSHLRKRKVPSQAFFNKMEVTPVPPELSALSEVEQRLLCRVYPFLKIMKLQNRFSQRWCKGQVVLFAQDVVEVAEQLPLSLSNCGIVIIAESLENVQQCRQFEVNVERVQIALQWLLKNNFLYRDVIPCFSSSVINDISKIVQVSELNAEEGDIPKVAVNDRFVALNPNVSILRGSFHQGSDRFSLESRGKQCTAVAAVACAAFYLLDANTWSISDIDHIVIVGDKFYRDCIEARDNPDSREMNVDYLAATELLPQLCYGGCYINIHAEFVMAINGHIDIDRSEEGFPNLHNGLSAFFARYCFGILTTNGVSVGIASNEQLSNKMFWLFDSHGRGPKGHKGLLRGVSCCMRFANVTELFNILRRNLRSTGGNVNFLNVYSITPLSLQTPNNTPDVAETLPLLTANDRFVPLNSEVFILRGSFHQGSDRFSMESRGRQCTAVAAVACAGFYLLDANTWSASNIDHIVVVGDKFYRDCIAARRNPDVREVNIEYLAVTELLPQLLFSGCWLKVQAEFDVAINGHIDTNRSEEGFPNLRNGLNQFFGRYSVGIVTANATSVAIACSNIQSESRYWLFDSHSRGPRGEKSVSSGVSCCVRFGHIDELFSMLQLNLKLNYVEGNDNFLNIYCITPLSLEARGDGVNVDIEQVTVDEPMRILSVNNVICSHQISSSAQTSVIVTTNLLHSIDEGVPNIENIISSNGVESERKLVDIKRKTAPPLNIERERRMEELGWYFLYPDGRNGFGEHRDISITPLDYFQARVLSNEKRFQRTDYLFFALSVVEYFRAKSSVSVSCRMRQGEHTPQGLVDNMHLTMRNIRGSASYWRRCCSELIAMVRTLGPPTWFATFSCNDLNWPDMLKALLIADGRPDFGTDNLAFQDRLALVQNYPVVVARQFMLRVNALMRFLKHNSECMGGEIIDFWYRIEFQNRGSPHLHMLLWCENIPDFHTAEGISLMDRIVSCSLGADETDLYQLVRRVQIHKHSETCYKGRNNRTCRFGFPRPISENTVCLGPDEAIANNGRFSVLRRSVNEVMVNNYNGVLLNIWQANMDIQPCGSVTAVAYYIAKYASKCEPHDSGDVVREAIQRAKRQSCNAWKQLFSVSMAILSQRLVSAPECAFRLCHLPLKMSSRKAIFVNSCRPEQRFRMLRFDGDDTSFCNNIVDRYEQRPDNLEDLSLSEFAVRYETVSSSMWTEEDGDIELRDETENTSRFIKLRDNTVMRIRNKAAVLRHRYYTLNSDREGYYYSLIVCHIPFRRESELVAEGETAEACFLRRQGQLRPLLGNVSAEEFTHAEQVLQQALAQAVAFNVVNEENDNIGEAPDLHADEQINFDVVDDFDEEGDPTVMSDDDFVAGIRCLNIQQKDLLRRVSDCIEHNIRNESTEVLLLFITGGAGSGKTFLLKLLVEHIKRCYAPTVDVLLKPAFVEVASLTGVAARQISGRTLHSVFSLPIEKGSSMTYRRMSGARLEQERRKWRHIKWLVIDEISMVSYENLRIIHLRLQEFKCNEMLFGGVSVLLFGDIMQLPPVKGHWCFIQPPWCSGEINLWQQFSFCELSTNMRQKGDTEFVDLLNTLRFGELTTSQLQVLCERRRVPLVGEFADGEAVRIFPTIKLVDEYNAKITEEISKSSVLYTIRAVDESRELATYGRRPPGNVIPVDVNNCGGLMHSIKLAEGSRVMLRRNIAVSDGLVNGAMGIVKKFKWPALRRDQIEEGELPDALYVKFDDNSVGARIKDAEGLVGIAPVSATFQAIKGYGDVERRMLPVILSWAVTVHKLQGTTLDKAVIDLGNKNFAKGQVYVALSRVRTLNGIALSDLVPNKLLKKPHDEKSLNEMLRLRELTS